MYRILKTKKGKPHYKNVLYLYLTQYPSKFFVNLVAKKTLQTRPKFFTLSRQSTLFCNVFYKLEHKTEFKKNRTELYLTFTGLCFKRVLCALYTSNNTLRRVDKDIVISFL